MTQWVTFAHSQVVVPLAIALPVGLLVGKFESRRERVRLSPFIRRTPYYKVCVHTSIVQTWDNGNLCQNPSVY